MNMRFTAEHIGSYLKSLLIVALATSILLPLYSQPEITNTGSLSFSDLVKDVENTSGYKIALQAYEKILREENFYSHPGDAELTAQPAVKNQTTEWGAQGQTDLTMSTGISFFLGKSLIQEDRYRAAVRAVRAAQMELSSTRREEILSLYILYSELWLLQQEEPVLVDEKLLAEDRYNRFLQLYENGSATLMDVEDASDELQLAEDSINQNLLKQRLTWFSLLQARGGMKNEQIIEIPDLNEFWFEVSTEEKPGTISGQVLETSAERQKQINTIISLKETSSRLEQLDWNLQFKPFFSYGDHDWTLTYNLENRNMNFDYSFPVATYNRLTNQTNQDSWITGVSIVLSFGTGKSDKLETDVYQSEILLQEELLHEQTDKLSLELRSVYQRLLQAVESLKQAETSLQRQIRLTEAVNTRFEAGQALKSDSFSADIAERRSQWKKASARIEVQQAYLTLMVLTGDLSFVE